MTVDAIIFDFDGVLVESEYVSAAQLATGFTEIGRPTTIEQSLDRFMGLSGANLIAALEAHFGGPIPDAFSKAREAEDARVLSEGLEAVAGAIAFVRAMPAMLPRAIASSSTTHWIDTHLDHLELRDAFASHIYSGREHVTRGKPAPDIYLYAAAQLGVSIARCAIIEDSPVGVRGAVASGARVIGLAVGRHCVDGHDAKLHAEGATEIAHSFAEVTAFLQS